MTPPFGGPWPIGGSGEVAWIARGTVGPGLTVTTAIPPVFEAYATVVVPDAPAWQRDADAIVAELLRRHSRTDEWWLGYLDDGVCDVIVPEAPRVEPYADLGWPYVLLKAGPSEAVTWRADGGGSPWRGTLPELVFPVDHSWLVSTMWDDDWRCVGGPQALVDELVGHPDLEARAVAVDEVATPPGHQAL